jgi:hypothetical protein
MRFPTRAGRHCGYIMQPTHCKYSESFTIGQEEEHWIYDNCGTDENSVRRGLSCLLRIAAIIAALNR